MDNLQIWKDVYTISHYSSWRCIHIFEILIEKRAILSRYLAQRLLLQFGQVDERLIRLKLQNEAI